VTITSHPHLAPGLKKHKSYFYTPPCALYGYVIYKLNFTFALSVMLAKVTKTVANMCAVCLMLAATKYEQGDITVAKYANSSLKKQK